MQYAFFITFLLLTINGTSTAQLPPVGMWREHLPYRQNQQVAINANGVLCATPSALFSVETSDNTIERINKLTGLSEVAIRCMHYDAISGKIIVGYTSGNIDILRGKKVNNIDALKRKEINADKAIYRITTAGNNAYLSTGLGIVVVDTKKNEIKDTWVVGSGGAYTAVYGVAFSNNTVFVATAEGAKQATIAGNNLSDYRNWELLSGVNGLNAGACNNVIKWENSFVVQKGDSLFQLVGSTWALLYASDWAINDINISENKLLIAQQKSGKGRVLVLAASGIVERVIQPSVLQSPQQAALLQGSCWVADAITGLWQIGANNNAQSFLPNSPYSISDGEMVVAENGLWVAAGSVTTNWTNAFTENGIFNFKEENWVNYNTSSFPSLAGIYDIVTIVPDKNNRTVWLGSFGEGLLQLKEDKSIQRFKQNSSLEPSLANPARYNIAGLAMDQANNLWISNYGAASLLQVKKADGTWRKFAAPFFLTGHAVAQIVIDDLDQKWMVSPNENGLLCFNHGQTIDNPADDKWKQYRAGKGNGNLPDNKVLCIAKDKNGFIWVGTSKGIGVVQCVQNVFSTSSCEAIQPIVQQDNFAGLLFGEELVQAIAVDGANRKWVGTQNGVWLISGNAEKVIYRFTESNSPLLSNHINRIAIDGSTGEVFFSTSKGICSFRSTATEGAGTQNKVLVFPNPVPPGYNGTIAIRGLVDNSIVKITELDGRLVYQALSLGGQAVWNGRDYRGRTIASGVYLVLVSDESRKEKTAAKIMFVSK